MSKAPTPKTDALRVMRERKFANRLGPKLTRQNITEAVAHAKAVSAAGAAKRAARRAKR